MSANVETMFSTREKPWHGLGTIVMEAPTSEEALKLAGLDWNVVQKYPKDQRLFPVVAEAVQHKMKRHIEKAGVKKIRVHDLRHSHVAYLIHQGIEPLMIKQRLGHKDIKITLNTYGHLYPNEGRKLADTLDRLKNQQASEFKTLSNL